MSEQEPARVMPGREIKENAIANDSNEDFTAAHMSGVTGG